VEFEKRLHDAGIKMEQDVVDHTLYKRIYYIYRWHEKNIYHLSGYGTDVPGHVTGPEQVKRFVDSIIHKGALPVGNVELKPQWKQEYTNVVAAKLTPSVVAVSPAAIQPPPTDESLDKLAGRINRGIKKPRPANVIIDDTVRKIDAHANDGGPWDSLKELVRLTRAQVELKQGALGSCWVKRQWKRVVDSYIVVTRKESGKPMTDTLPSE